MRREERLDVLIEEKIQRQRAQRIFFEKSAKAQEQIERNQRALARLNERKLQKKD